MDQIPEIVRDLSKLEQKVDERHEENLRRFGSIEIKMAEIAGEVKIIVALLAANVVLNMTNLFLH